MRFMILILVVGWCFGCDEQRNQVDEFAWLDGQSRRVMTPEEAEQAREFERQQDADEIGSQLRSQKDREAHKKRIKFWKEADRRWHARNRKAKAEQREYEAWQALEHERLQNDDDRMTQSDRDRVAFKQFCKDLVQTVGDGLHHH